MLWTAVGGWDGQVVSDVERDGADRAPTWVVGLNHGVHDSAAALLRDGQLAVMVEQERLSRHKRAVDEPPVEALRFCLDHEGLSLSDLGGIALGSDLGALASWLGLDADERAHELPFDDPARLLPASVFGDGPRPPLVPVRHHIAHAASAFWMSGFERAAILVVDNRGEDASTTLGLGTGAEMKELESFGVSQSLGLYYRAATQYAGLYDRFEGPGKLMGLAAYGRPDQPVPLKVAAEGPVLDGLPELHGIRGKEVPPTRTSQLLDYFAGRCFPFTTGLRQEVLAYANFAASVQDSLEESVVGLARRVRDATGSSNIVLAGGVALNCSANGRLASSGLFEQLFVQPVAHDAGVALGAALELTRRLRPDARVGSTMTHAYWGPSFTQHEINAALRRASLPFELLDRERLVSQVAEELQRGRIVGWFQGRAEVGPRALGARSLIGDPRSRHTLVRLNTIKGREMWRPVAPSVLLERFSDYFSEAPPNPFMVVAARVRREVRHLVPAIVHVDGSARPQAVSRQTAPTFWALLSEFERRTGVPMVVNTSFNLRGEPIVSSPRDAIDDFLAADIDVLAIGEALVRSESCRDRAAGSG